MAHAHRAWCGNSAEDISVPSTKISTRIKYLKFSGDAMLFLSKTVIDSPPGQE